MNIRKLDHVSFLVRDVERSKRFYSQVLGLHELARPSSTENTGAWLTNNEHSFELHLIGESEPGRVTQTHGRYLPYELANGYGSHAAFEVENVEETLQHLQALHIEIVGGPRQRGDGVQQIFLCDPDEYLLELFAR